MERRNKNSHLPFRLFRQSYIGIKYKYNIIYMLKKQKRIGDMEIYKKK